jgi:hypothetical protein
MTARQLRPAPPNARASLYQAMAALRQACSLAREADCPALVKKIDSAIASAGGAQRHLDRRLTGQPAQAAPVDTYLDRFPAHVRAFAERAYNDGFLDGATSEREERE